MIRTVHHAVLDRGGGAGESPGERSVGSTEIAPWLRMLLVGTAIVLGGTVVLAILLFVFGALYEAKSLAGIDIFPDWHLVDLFRH